MLIIYNNLFSCYFLLQGFQTLLVTKTVIRFSFFHQFLCIFQINSGGHSLALYIWSISFVLIRSLVVSKSCLCQGTVDNVNRPFHKTFLIGIFDSQNKISALMLGNEELIQCGS